MDPFFPWALAFLTRNGMEQTGPRTAAGIPRGEKRFLDGHYLVFVINVIIG